MRRSKRPRPEGEIDPLPTQPSVNHTLHAQEKPWPARALVVKVWPQAVNGERDVLLCDVLRTRGWADGGGFCDADNMSQLPLVLSGKHPKYPLPRRALWIPGDAYETQELFEAFGSHPKLASRFRVSTIPGTSLACYKTYTAKALACSSYVPLTFILPAQRAELLAAASAMRKEAAGKNILWVGKPKCNYAGRGIIVTEDVKGLAEAKSGVVQRYLHQPLLIGQYKFHMRVYMLVTSLDPPCAYVHNDMAVMFATRPYTTDPSSLGARFDPCVHLTNYDINAHPRNLDAYLADKPGPGRGCLWGARRLEMWLRHTRPDISIDGMWHQIRSIGREVCFSIADHPNVRKSLRRFPFVQQIGHELFGIDVMLDADGKCWLLECNDSPGLEYCGSHLADGTPSPDAEEGDATTRAVVHDRLALLGFDRDVCVKGEPSNFLRVC
jgi:hypothetical protein